MADKLLRLLRWLAARLALRPVRPAAWVAACVLAVIVGSPCAAAQPLPRSILILNQSTALRPWPTRIIAAIQASTRARPLGTISYYVEHLDLYAFDSPQYREILKTHFKEKYRDKPIGVVIAIGPGALAVALELRATIWPTTPIVFAAVDQAGVPAPLPPGVTGNTFRMTLASMLQAADVVVPDLKSFAIVGNRFEDQLYYRRFADELPAYAKRLQFIDLMGLPVEEVERRVAALPDDSVILYLGINSDPNRIFTSGAEALPLVVKAANRPIVVGAETFFGSGAVGGFILSPERIGRDAGRLALRILDGEDAASIPVTLGDSVKPLFDWRALQRWNVPESTLPAGSELRFRAPTVWGQYSWEIASVVIIIALQMALIIGLLYEHRRRRAAEALVRTRMAELAHMSRLATAGELTASIAHEITQPLAGIVAYAEAGLRWLNARTPDVGEALSAFRQIAGAGHRASDVIDRIRAFFTAGAPGDGPVDINALIREVLGLVRPDLARREIAVETALAEGLPAIPGDHVQLQQVMLNLIANAADAMEQVKERACVLRVASAREKETGVLVRVEDSGSGIAPDDLDHIFKPLYTTKAKGMGMGLSITRSLVEAHGGRLWASAGTPFGTVFTFVLPLARPQIHTPRRERPPVRTARDRGSSAA